MGGVGRRGGAKFGPSGRRHGGLCGERNALVGPRAGSPREKRNPERVRGRGKGEGEESLGGREKGGGGGAEGGGGGRGGGEEGGGGGAEGQRGEREGRGGEGGGSSRAMSGGPASAPQRRGGPGARARAWPWIRTRGERGEEFGRRRGGVCAGNAGSQEFFAAQSRAACSSMRSRRS